MKDKGIIFNIQRFSIHDGPGIRTTVFMKGCPLRCRWCSNPESQTRTPQIMVRPSKCVGCGACAAACPEQAIVVPENQPARTDWNNCTQCLKCVPACLYGAREIVGRKVTVNAVFEEVDADRVFYDNSGGGVTVSGGEPLMQHEFVAELLKKCRSHGLRTAIETSGQGTKDAAIALAAHADLVLFDIKQLNPLIHRKYTGVDNQQILSNAALFADRVETWFRIPLVAGVNDDPDHMAAAADLAVALGVRKISLLPYHEGGVSKADQIGLKYRLPEGQCPDDDHIRSLVRVTEARGIVASIGK